MKTKFNLGAIIEKLFGVPQFGDQIVIIDPRGKFDLLDLAGRHLRVRRLLLLLVNVFAEIHDPANRGRRMGSHLHEVQIKLLRQFKRGLSLQNTELFALRRDNPDFRNPDALVAPNMPVRVAVSAVISSATTAFAAAKRKGCSHQIVINSV